MSDVQDRVREDDVQQIRSIIGKIEESIKKVFVGKEDIIRLLVSLLTMSNLFDMQRLLCRKLSSGTLVFK